jgi:hypothetical protein
VVNNQWRVTSNNKENLVMGSGFKDVCTKCTSGITFDTSLLDSENNTTSIDLRLSALVIDASIDVVIGLATVKSNDLILHYPSKFLSSKGLELLQTSKTYEVQRNTDTILLGTEETESGRPVCSLLDVDVLSNSVNMTEGARAKLPLRMHYDLQVENDLVPTKYGINSNANESYEDTLTSLDELDNSLPQATNFSTRTEWVKEDISEIRMDQLESIEAEYLVPHKEGDSDFEMPTKIFGPDSLRKKPKGVLNKFKEQFRITVGKEPAKLEPFSLELISPEKDWFTSANKLPPRKLDKTRQFEMNKLIMLLITLCCVQTSTATHYSHPFVVPNQETIIGGWF